MKLYKVCTKKEIEVDGEKKMLWFQAGSVKIRENGGWFLTMFHQPETDFYIFEPKEERLPEIQLER